MRCTQNYGSVSSDFTGNSEEDSNSKTSVQCEAVGK